MNLRLSTTTRNSDGSGFPSSEKDHSCIRCTAFRINLRSTMALPVSVPRFLANRLGVGPMWDCTGVQVRGVFPLGDWRSGADSGHNGQHLDKLILGDPDDPSNVHHSYIGDHVKMRVVHAGPKSITFITCMRTSGCKHLTTTTRPTSTVRRLDQASRFTEITHGGSGNKTRLWAIQFSTAASIHTLLKACGNCGARTTF